jgi:hypothetical protein
MGDRALNAFEREAEHGERAAMRAYARDRIPMLRAEIDLADRVRSSLDSL